MYNGDVHTQASKACVLLLDVSKPNQLAPTHNSSQYLKIFCTYTRNTTQNKTIFVELAWGKQQNKRLCTLQAGAEWFREKLCISKSTFQIKAFPIPFQHTAFARKSRRCDYCWCQQQCQYCCTCTRQHVSHSMHHRHGQQFSHPSRASTNCSSRKHDSETEISWTDERHTGNVKCK